MTQTEKQTIRKGDAMNTTRDKATARPWEIAINDSLKIVVPDGDFIAETDDPYNAALIVKAVNTHDSLVEAMEKIAYQCGYFDHCKEVALDVLADLKLVKGGEV